VFISFPKAVGGNTTIVYHARLAVTFPAFAGTKFILLGEKKLLAKSILTHVVTVIEETTKLNTARYSEV